ncbi:unnamed protein product [Phytophthora fragariaefolia]|uniref:Unnamed protein product n=1 Tax=Phytophthora fragariaefolia TaxID=1490495 RepID=A0A9W7D3E7_9STRA|nr:unnamed protein product [Phytophthora fragariaefolia]
MVCSVEEALSVLKQLKSSPVLSALEYSSVVTLAMVLESFARMDHEFDAIDAELASTKTFLASVEAEHLSAEKLASKVLVAREAERELPLSEKALADLWDVGPHLRVLVEMLSSWLLRDREFLQPDYIVHELVRLRLRHFAVAQKLQEIRVLLEGLETLTSLGRAFGAIDLKP